jgi:hypothetical protein
MAAFLAFIATGEITLRLDALVIPARDSEIARPFLSRGLIIPAKLIGLIDFPPGTLILPTRFSNWLLPWYLERSLIGKSRFPKFEEPLPGTGRFTKFEEPLPGIGRFTKFEEPLLDTGCLTTDFKVLADVERDRFRLLKLFDFSVDL